jgi:6-phosphofructokinase 1
MVKGALAVGQSGGPTAVMNATLAGVVREAGAQAAVGQIFGLRHGIEGALSDDLIDLRRHDGRTLDLVARTPAAALGSSRHKVRDDDLEPTLRTFRAHDVRYFLLIGGNDSMDTCHRIVAAAEQSNYALTVVGVPKTIDNDLPVTDHCPGYGSAARFVALAAMSVGVDLEAMSTFDDVSILETMGRNTGWLAAASVLGKRGPADPPHLICLPERVFDEAAFLDRVRRAHETYGQGLCVVAEGLRDAGGRLHFRTPRGRPIRETLAPPAVPCDPVWALVMANRACGLAIGARTGCPSWGGERLDLGWAIDVLHPAANPPAPRPVWRNPG